MIPALAAFVLLLAADATPAGPRQPLVAPPSSWVEPLRPDLSLPASPGASGGIDYLLLDEQVRTGPGPVERYHHFAHRLLTSKGVENGSEVRAEFDPAYQELVLHAVTIHRGGRRINALRPGEVKLIQREPELDRRLFDGRVTAVIFVRDARRGDVIEAAWTVHGANPVFGRRWARRFTLAYDVPVARLSVRVISPETHRLAYRVTGVDLAPAVARLGDFLDQRWTRTAVASVEAEGDVPPGGDPFPRLELSEWPSWSAVREWAQALYAPDALTADGQALVGRWRALPDATARAQAALRFVQDDIRYLGFELGPSSHRPHSPSEVLARAFGDCKDKSLLLVSFLRALGFEAAPALVSTDGAASVEARLPSPLAFDHVIVRAVVDGRAVWLEPTRSMERAPLTSVEPPPYGRALVIEAGEDGLATIPEPGPALMDVVSTYRITRFGAPVALDVVTTFSGRRAIAMRHQLAEGTPADLQKQYLEYYARSDPKVKVAQPLEVTDADTADHLVLRERYELPPIVDGEDRGFVADGIWAALQPPASSLRKQPLRIQHPVAIRERFLIELPGPPSLASDDVVVSDEAARLSRRSRPEGNAYVVDLEYRSLKPALPAAAVPKHIEALREMRRVVAFGLALAVRPPGAAGRYSEWFIAGAFGAILLIGVALFVGVTAAFNGDLRRWRMALKSWRRRRAFRAKFRLEAGEAPAAPIRIASPAEAPAAVATLRCSCGGTLRPPDGPGKAVRYGGRELLVLTLACDRCRGSRMAYLAVAP